MAQAADFLRFGDGSGANGTSVTHAYSSAGPFQVTVTATDAVGNASSAARTVSIAPVSIAPVSIAPVSIAPQSFGPDTKVSIKGPAKVKVKGGAVTLRVENGNGFAVSGSLALTSSARLSRRAAAARASRLTTLASKSFTAAAGQVVKVKLKLSAKARRALAMQGRLAVKAKATVRDPAGNARTISRKLTLVQAKR